MECQTLVTNALLENETNTEFQFANPKFIVETWHVLDYPISVACLGKKIDMGIPWFANLKPKWKPDTF